jgi:thioredoxin 1
MGVWNMTMIHVNDQTVHNHITKSGVTLIDFGAQWCPPCKALHPILEGLDGQYDQQITILTVDCDESPQVAAQYGIMSMPTVVVMNEGVPVEKLVGLRPIHAYEQVIERYSVKV